MQIDNNGRKGVTERKTVHRILFVALEYLREYCTYFHVGTNYELSESQAIITHRWVEKELIKDKRFHLPRRKKLLESDYEVEVVLVDAAESPVKHPKQN